LKAALFLMSDGESLIKSLHRLNEGIEKRQNNEGENIPKSFIVVDKAIFISLSSQNASPKLL
jgi:hypothetical protein